jgi:hypothetical protein
MENIMIKTGAATEDAQQIYAIVNGISEDMQTLDEAIRSTVCEGTLQTDWSDTLKDNWTRTYNSSIPEAMEEMKFSAKNLEKAVQEALAYSQER